MTGDGHVGTASAIPVASRNVTTVKMRSMLFIVDDGNGVRVVL